jgi:hypothetical protein
MSEAGTSFHWRALVVGAVAIGCFAAIATGGEGRTCAQPLQRAQAALRDSPSPMGFRTTNPDLASDFDLAAADGPAACPAATSKATGRDAQRALERTVTQTTAVAFNRNASHAIAVAQAP